MKFLRNIIICALVFSCGNEKNSRNDTTTDSPTTKIEKKDSVFRVSLTAKIREDDKLQLLYIVDSPDGKYDSKNRIEANVTGKQKLQTMVFELPKNILPYKFRIDLGEKGHETTIEIDNIKIEMNTNKIVVDSSTIHRYFQKNIYLDTEDWMTFKRKSVTNRYDPFLTSKAFLIKKIELEF